MPRDPAEFKPFVDPPPVPPQAVADEAAPASISPDAAAAEPSTKAEILARDVFAAHAQPIDGLEYAIAYHLADDYAGGDVIDVYHYDNGSVSFLAADVEGRGVAAASRAALIKFSLRAYASAGMTVEQCAINLDRAYLESGAFEKHPSFASVFFGQVDNERRTFAYCSAGHDVAILARPGERAILLPVTAPVIGVFEEQRHLFRQRYLELVSGCLLVLGTDGITEARSSDGTFFGTERLLKVVEASRNVPVQALVDTLLRETLAFCNGNTHDDIAMAAVRFD